MLVYSVVELEEIAEFLHRCGIAFAEVSRDEALGLDDDILHEGVVLLRSSGLLHLVCFSHEVASPLVFP